MPIGINNIHDKFFKSLLANKQTAIDFLKTFMPEDLQSHLNLSTLQYEKTGFVAKGLEEYFSDIVLRCKQKGTKKNCYISVILEHKSFIEKYAAVKLLAYLGNAYMNQLKAGRPLELIVPLLFYNSFIRNKK